MVLEAAADLPFVATLEQYDVQLHYLTVIGSS